MKTPNFIDDLTNYLFAIKNYSKVYITNLTITVKQFLEFMNVYKFKNKYDSIESFTLNDIRCLSNSDVYSFIFYLAENQYKTNSRIIKIEHLRTFFDYLFRIKHNIFKEPFKKIKREKQCEQKLPNYLSLEESKKLIQVYQNSTKVNEIRDNAILHLFLNCGLRLSEVRNLNIDDFNLQDNKFTVIGKGNKERTAYLNKSTKTALLKYLEIRKNIITKFKKDENALFISRHKTRLSVSMIKKLVKKAYSLANIDTNEYATHTLRHTCATLLYRNGIDIKIIKEILGHVQIDTTEIYTHLHDQEVKNAMLEHPLSNFKMADALTYCA